MIILSAHNLEKSYAGRTLFTNLSFGIEEGDRIGLVGPNGAGKTTLLRILSGEIEADSGGLTSKRGLRIGFLHQTPHFAPGATIVQTVLERTSEPGEYHGRALELLGAVGLLRFGEDFLVNSLSGGWQKRVALARELLLEPDLFFLDEPTNHLDISGVLWLEEFLRSTPATLLMVTHDRLFLQRVANRIVDLDSRNPNYILSVQADYTQYLETKDQILAAQRRKEDVETNRLRRETEWLRRGAKARQTKQKARKEAAVELVESVHELKLKNQQRSVGIDFGEAEHSPKRLIEAKGIGKQYRDKQLFSNLDLLISPKTRLGLLGDNGSGKSTLIKILLGMEEPDEGRVLRAEGLEVSYFEQSRETLDPALSVLKNVCPEGDYVFFQGQSVHVRSYLDRFFFSGHKVDLPVAKLSGGEQARLRLAQLMLKRCQILVLDEPTNDLDSETLDALSESLRTFQGAVILVSHDRYFLDCVANQILSFPDLGRFADYFQWESWFREYGAKKPSAKSRDSSLDSEVNLGSSHGANQNPGRVLGRLTYKEKFELENMESTISKLESDLVRLTEESQRPEVLTDHHRLKALHQQLAEGHALLEQKFDRWAELDAKSKS